ncbi:MAG: response regulator [Pirellulaceae bacterium]|nr:response regulator [Pirellulaceae bacterium]
MTAPDQILVVDDSPTQLAQLKMLLVDAGYEVCGAENGEIALGMALEKMPAVVVTDMQMPVMGGLELVERLKEQAPSIPVILTTSQGSEEIAAEALQKGAASYVPKRDIRQALAPTVRQVIALRQVSRQQSEVAKFAVESSIELSLVNDESLVPSVITRLEQPMVELDLFDEVERMQIAMAIDEALLNAIIHGNLEVSSELRQSDDGKPYVDMIAQRKQEDPYRQRRVHVRLEATPGQIKFTIRDEGPGFDASEICDPTDPENLEKAGGRGLLLINAFMDEVKHNDVGNEIMMLKRKVESNGEAS